MSATRIPGWFVDEELGGEQRVIVELLTRAYWMEIETVMNYIAASIGHDGRARAAMTALREGVEEEVGHARALGRRIQDLHGVVPGVEGLASESDDEYPQPFGHQADAEAMIEAVVATETSAIRHYMRIMRATRDIDQDTNDLVLNILRDEQRHLRVFEGYLREFAAAA